MLIAVIRMHHRREGEGIRMHRRREGTDGKINDTSSVFRPAYYDSGVKLKKLVELTPQMETEMNLLCVFRKFWPIRRAFHVSTAFLK